MNKAELIAKISDDAGITKTQANATLDSFVAAVTKTLKAISMPVLEFIVDKKLFDKYKITKELVSEAYPDIIWGNRS